MIKIGIIGCGFMGKKHANHLSKNLTDFKESNKLEIIGEIMSRKENDEKNLIGTLYPVKIEDENMKVLAYQYVNTS
jgi:pyrroline-5-carboxylate reductase